MKRKKKIVIPAAILASTAVGGGLHVLNINQVLINQPGAVAAYTSAVNAQEPTTAPDSYNIVFTDINLKRALNKALANVLNTPGRSLDSNINVGEAKQVFDLQKERTLDNSNITNLEGLQYFLNLKLVDANINKIADLAPIADLPHLEDLRLNENPNITDITPLARLPKLKKLQFGKNKISNFSALATAPVLEELQINGAPKLEMASLSGLTKIKFLNLNGTGLKSDSFGPIKNLPLLKRLTIGGNGVVDLQEVFSGGFAQLDSTTQLNNQYYTHPKLSLNQALFANPVKTPDGKVVPLTETDKIKNADPDGTLNPNGTHVKLVNFTKADYGQKRLVASWEARFNHGAMTNQVFSGKVFNIDYNIPADETNPIITPAQPEKIVSRKGRAVDLSDVTAEDNPGGSGLKSLTNDAVAQGLDVTNPAKGDYTITYTATDNQDNQAVATRQVEITDADALKAVIDSITPEFLDGYKLDAKAEAREAKKIAEQVYNLNSASQSMIDQALIDLNNVLNNLESSKRPIELAIQELRKAEKDGHDYVLADPDVAAAQTYANRIYNQKNAKPAVVKQAAEQLLNAITAAKQAEQDRQTAAEQLLQQVEVDKNSQQFSEMQTRLDAVKQTSMKQQLQARFDAVKQEFAAKKQALKAKIDQANDPATTDGMKQDGVNNLKAQVVLAEALYAQIDTNAKQADVEAMTAKLEQLINKLEIDVSAIDNALAALVAQPSYIQTDSAVVAAKAEAERVKALPSPTKEQITKAVQDLNQAVQAALQAEQNHQTTAENLVAQAETDKTVYVFDQAETAINQVQNPAKKAQLNTRLQAAKQAYDNAKNTLQNAILTAENPATTDGMSAESVARLQQALTKAKQAMAAQTSQQVIETARDALNQAISQLEVDKTALNQAIAEHDTQPDYIKNDSAVLAAKAEADRIKALPTANKNEVQQAANDLKNAIQAAQQSELNKQAQAEQELAQAAANLSPASITAAQGKIDTVQDPAKKAELQAKLDALKQKLADQKQALRVLIDKAQDPATVDGMTDATKNALLAKIADAILIRDAAGADSGQILTATQELQQAINDLRADKTGLEAALTTAEAEPAYLKGKPVFRRALDGGRATRNNPNPTVAEVRAAIKALQDAKPEAVLQETQAQQAMTEALEAAQKEIDKLPTLANNQLFNIDLDMLEHLIGQVDEPVKKTELRARLDAIKTAYNKRKTEVEAQQLKSPNSGYQKQANIGLLTSVISLPVAIIALAVKKLKR